MHLIRRLKLFAHVDLVRWRLTLPQMSNWFLWPNAKQMQSQSLSLCLPKKKKKKANELSQWGESPSRVESVLKCIISLGKGSCLDMKLTPAAGKLSTSVGVVQSKEPAVSSDLPSSSPTRPASKTNSPAATSSGGSQKRAKSEHLRLFNSQSF